MLNELKEYATKSNVDDVVAAGDLSEDVFSNNAKQFMIELGLFDTHEEVSHTGKEKRDSTRACGTKCVDVVFASEGTLSVKVGIEPVE